MMRRSLLTCLFVLIATTTLAAPPPVNPADALAFMHQLWDRAAELLNHKTDVVLRRVRFRQLFDEDFDGPDRGVEGLFHGRRRAAGFLMVLRSALRASC